MESQEEKVVYRTLRQIGRSISVTLPPEYVKSNNLSPKQWVKLVYTDTTIRIIPVEKK